MKRGRSSKPDGCRARTDPGLGRRRHRRDDRRPSGAGRRGRDLRRPRSRSCRGDAEEGLGITGPMVEFTVPAKAVTADQLQGRFARVFLCVKAQDTADASRALLPHVTEDGYVVSAQNGLNELAIAKIVGEARTMGCFVNFGADYIEPGVIHYGGRGAVVVGEIDGKETPRLTGAASTAAQVRRARSADAEHLGLSLGQGSLWRDAVRHRAHQRVDRRLPGHAERHRRLYIALAREILAVAAAREVRARGVRRLRSRAPSARASSEAAAPLARRARRAQPPLGQDAQRHLARPRRAQAARPRSTRSSASSSTLGAEPACRRR